ncbi:MAG TPA: cold shock domain-containing protein [Aggregatilineales bacterium]|nr:cold shock domain-containing protein [Aggregatilineales bacterium]
MDIIASRFHGIVREFDRNRGLGTIELDNGENVSVRYSAIIGEGVRILRSGDRVACDVEVTHKGSCAVRVERE